jgi:hypothetical protein
MIKREIKGVFGICQVKLDYGILANKAIAAHMVLNSFNGILMDPSLIHTIRKVRTTAAVIGLR